MTLVSKSYAQVVNSIHRGDYVLTLDTTEFIKYKRIRIIAKDYGFKIKDIKPASLGWYEAITRDNRTELLIHVETGRLLEYDDLRREYKEVE